MERHTVSRLIGAPPGYVGFDQGGLLTDAIDQHPHSVLLLDEIEKAHPDLFNILLQVMDYGKLTDHNGKNVDFRNVILIMTTNAGASDLAKPAIGFGSGIREGDDQEAINRMFTPEFRNRLDAVISFAPLAPETIGRVVDKFVLQLEEQLADRNVTIELDDDARELAGRRRATTRCSAPARSAASSRSTSRSRSPRSCCSGSSRRAGSSRCRSTMKPTSSPSPSASARQRRRTSRRKTSPKRRNWSNNRVRSAPLRRPSSVAIDISESARDRGAAAPQTLGFDHLPDRDRPGARSRDRVRASIARRPAPCPASDAEAGAEQDIGAFLHPDRLRHHETGCADCIEQALDCQDGAERQRRAGKP